MKTFPLIAVKAVPYILFCLVFLVVLSSNGNSQTESITDRQGNTYKTVRIGDQTWMAENLRATKYANGDDIPHITIDSIWANTHAGAYCYYENNAENIRMYGNLYNWYTVNNDKGVCPEGWHVPSDHEWMTLEEYLGMTASEAGRMTAWRGTHEGDKLKVPGFGGNNSSGFSVIGSGYRDPMGIFKAQGTDNDFWTSTPYTSDNILNGILHGFLNTKSTVVRNFHVPGYGFCVRCIMDKITGSGEPDTPKLIKE
jgi:uncharacterized protein (TIGR02145 family)